MEDPLKTDCQDLLRVTRGLKKQNMHSIDEKCTFCSSKVNLMSPAQSITYRHLDIQYKMTIMELLIDLNMNEIFKDQLKEKICSSCINSMRRFFLFKKKCLTKPSTTYSTNSKENLINKIPKNETTVILEKWDTPKVYLSQPSNFINCAKCAQHITENGDCEVTHVNSETSHKCEICKTKFTSLSLTFDYFQNHSFAELGIEGIQRRIDLLECTKCDLKNLTWKQYLGHVEMHDHESVTQLMVKNIPFCYCCLQSSDRLVPMTEEVFLAGHENEKINVATLLSEVLGTGDVNCYDGAVMCDTCLNKIIQAYCFQVMNKKSKQTLNNCLVQLEQCLQATEELNFAQGQSVHIRIHYDLNKSINETDLNSCAMSDTSDRVEVSQRRRGFAHICTICRQQFTSEKQLKIHRKSNHQVSCTVCHEIINQKDNESHMKDRHLLSKLICNECNKYFYDKTKLQNHIVSHKTYESGQAKCNRCSGAFVTHFDRVKHKCIKYKCIDCAQYPCIHEKYIKKYKEDEKTNPKAEHKCLDCDFTYVSKRTLIEHANVLHLSYYPYLCSKCGEKLPSRAARYRHNIQEHSNYINKPYKCNFSGCRKKFLLEKEFVRHRENHFKKRKCALCDLSFTLTEMTRHKLLAHGIQTVRMCDVSCSMCTQNFDTKKDREEHEATHPPDTTHLCRICKKRFATRSERTEHSYSHLKREKRRRCKFCGEVVDRKSYPNHVKIHQSEDPIIKANTKTILKKHLMCDICGRRFSSWNGLNRHMLRHSNKEKKPNVTGSARSPANNSWICNYCQKSYCKKKVLEMHIESIHLYPKRFQCQFCDKRFNTKSQRTKHKVVHTRERKFQCNICFYLFVTKCALTYHMRLHTGERPYPCHLCDEKFLNASRRMAHIRKKHIGRTEQCTICTSSFYSGYALNKHMQLHFNPKSSLFQNKRHMRKVK